MATVLAIALSRYGIAHLKPIDLLRNLAVILGSYLFVFAMSFVVNFLRTPVLLDQEKAFQIGNLSEGLQKVEESAKETIDKKALQKQFAVLMGEGRNLQNDPEKSAVAAWKIRVNKALIEADLLADSVSFAHANDNLYLPPGIANAAYIHAADSRKVLNHCEVLEEIVKRKIS